MKRAFYAILGTALLLLGGLSHAHAQVGGGSAVYTNWFPQANSPSTSVSTSSAAHLYPGIGPSASICNRGTVDIYVNPFGTSNSVVATTNSYLIIAGACRSYNLKPSTTQYTYWAAITASGSSTVYLETGLGTPSGFGGMGSGGGVPSGPAGGDLGGTYPNPTVAHVSNAALNLPFVNVSTAATPIICDGVTNNSANMLTLLNSYSATGARFQFPAGVCLFSSTTGLIFPNDGGTAGDHPHQASFIFEGVSSYWDGYNQAENTYLNGTVFDLRGTNHRGMIQTFGAGFLGFRDITFTDKGSSAGNAFLYSTGTTLGLRDVAFVGSPGLCGGLSTNFANQDAIVLGGPLVDTYTTNPDSGFQGYGTNINHASFVSIQRALVTGSAVNSISATDMQIHFCDGSYAYGATSVSSIDSAGTGYSVGDTIAIDGSPYYDGWALFDVISVNGSGGVTAVTLRYPGAYPALPTGSQSQAYIYHNGTTVGGSGFTATLAWDHVGAAVDLMGYGATENYYQFTTLDMIGYPYGINASQSDQFIDAAFQDINLPGFVTAIAGVRILGAFTSIQAAVRGSANLPFVLVKDESASAIAGGCNISIIMAMGNPTDKQCTPNLFVPSLTAGAGSVTGGGGVKFVGGVNFPVTVQPLLTQSSGAQPEMYMLRSHAEGTDPDGIIWQWNYDGSHTTRGDGAGNITNVATNHCNYSANGIHLTCTPYVILDAPITFFYDGSGVQVGAFDAVNGFTVGAVTAKGPGTLDALALFQNGGEVQTIIATGTAPTRSGTCTTGSPVGGNTAGTFTATCTAQTVILTFATTAPHGWVCNAQDETTSADALRQTAHSTTSCTLTGTTAAADVIVFNAQGF